MERVLQYWDDLDDIVGMVAAYAEQFRRLALMAASVVLLTALMIGGVLLARAEPPLALAVATLLSVGLMYHSVTNPPNRIA